MPSDGLDTQYRGDGSLSTNGSMARSRAWRIALLVALSLLLAALLYVAYYYSQNRRAPSFTFSTNASETVQPLSYLYSFAGTGATSMTRPTGVAIDGDRCYVTDFAYRTVRAYTLDGTYLFGFGDIKDGSVTKMNSPVHIAVGPDNTIWVTDRALNALYVFDRDGKFLRKFLPNGDASYKWGPLALTFGPNGDLYVTDVGDSAKHQILVFGPDGKVKAQWGSTEQVTMATDSPGKFSFPNGIAVRGTGADTLVFVADGDNRRIQEFRPDGTFVSIINTSGTPRGVALDAQGRLYVVDALAHRVDMYNDAGDSLANFGENGVGPGQFSFPNDIAFNSADGHAFITDRDNNQVQVWGALVGEIPGITKITPDTAWVPFALAALVLLPLILLALRPRKFVATPDFIDGMIASENVTQMAARRFRWIVTEKDALRYVGKSAEGLKLDELLHGEPFSESDAAAIRSKLGVLAEPSQVLAMAKRAHVLCTEDIDLARFAVALGIDVYDRVSWLKRFGKKLA
ncbi:MAG TPA: NHL repeat-containing protein [Coriobacteriia bacterium]